jgi:hypothetical protein
LVEVPIEEAPERVAFAFFAWRFSFSDLLAAVFELFEPPLSLLAMVAPSREGETRVLNVPLWNPTKKWRTRLARRGGPESWIGAPSFSILSAICPKGGSLPLTGLPDPDTRTLSTNVAFAPKQHALWVEGSQPPKLA